MGDIRDGDPAGVSADALHAIPRPDLTLFQDSQVKSGSATSQESLDDVVPTELQPQFVARHAWFCDNHHCRPDPESISDPYIALQQPIRREVLTKHPPGKRHRGQLPLPGAIIL